MISMMKWKCFPHYWPFVRGIHRPPGGNADLWFVFDVSQNKLLHKHSSDMWHDCNDNMHRRVHVTMKAADYLGPYSHQAISSAYTDQIEIMVTHKG